MQTSKRLTIYRVHHVESGKLILAYHRSFHGDGSEMKTLKSVDDLLLIGALDRGVKVYPIVSHEEGIAIANESSSPLQTLTQARRHSNEGASSIVVMGDHVLVGTDGDGVGVFRKEASGRLTWIQTLAIPSKGLIGNWVTSIAVTEDHVFVGTPFEGVVVFRRKEDVFTRIQTLTQGAGLRGNWVRSIAVMGDLVLIGTFGVEVFRQ